MNVNVLKNTFHSRHLIDAINKRSLYLVPYGATNFSNNAATSIDLAIVDSSSKLVSFSKTDSPIAAGYLAINLVYKFVADKISNKTGTWLEGAYASTRVRGSSHLNYILR